MLTPSRAGAQAPPLPAAAPRWLKRLGPLGLLAALLWKFKLALAFLLSKGKLLLLGLTKSGTLFSMLASFAVYWTAWGWRFALGLVGAMYVHEMGHVAALRRLGIPATAPMFIPGLGAFVRMKQYPATPREDARVGLAGPLWGLGATLAALALHHVTRVPAIAAVAHASAWLNLFNLLPLGPLDGGRGFRALSRGQRWVACWTLGLAWLVTREGLLLLLLLAAGGRALGGGAPAKGDDTAFAQYLVLVAALALLCVIPVAGAVPW